MSSSSDTVGSLLADIANSITESLRVFDYADKTQWGPDEHEQRSRLEQALDEARKDFQELSPYLNGQRYYMNDRRSDSIEELRTLQTRFQFHATNFRDWVRQGGPINPLWAIETTTLSRDLHRAQCRAARRIYVAKQEQAAPRCLGAYLVYRKQRQWAVRRAQRRREQLNPPAQAPGRPNESNRTQPEGTLQPPSSPSLREIQRHRRKGSTLVPGDDRDADNAANDEYEERRERMEELALCNSIGKFERFGDRDVAFVCDYCDGYIVWEDLESMPSIRRIDEETNAAATESAPETADQPAEPDAAAAAAAAPRVTRPPPPETPGIIHWEATGFTVSEHKEKNIVFAPLAIANHVAPGQGEWVPPIRCPTCDDPPPDYTPPEGEEEDEGGGWQMDDELVFDDLAAFEDHLYWQHTPTNMPSLPISLPRPSSSSGCSLM